MKRYNKYLMQALLALPAIIFLVIPVGMEMWGGKTWKKLLIHSGFIATSLLIFSLALSPLNRLLPKIQFLKFFNRFRREIGLSVFFYACFHFLCAIVRALQKNEFYDLKYFRKLYILMGFIAFVILLLLAITSNNWSIKKMSYKNWKLLHRFVYVAEVFVFIHMFLKTPFYACVLILPLIALQLLCFSVTLAKNR